MSCNKSLVVLAATAILLGISSIKAYSALSSPNQFVQAFIAPADDGEPTMTVYGSGYDPVSIPDHAEPDVFAQNWETTHIFAYKNIDIKDLPLLVEIDLVNSLDDFCPPVTGRVSSRYGPRGRRGHRGVDVPLKTGDQVCAAFEGKVRYAKFNSGGFGNLVIIRHPNGLETWYGHLSKMNVKADDYVNAGDVIGLGGNTGRSKGSHLHFEVRYCDQNFDPEHIIDFVSGDLKYQTFVLEKSYLNIYSRASEKLDQDYENIIFAANSADGALTSEDIISNISKHADKQPAPGTVNPAYHTIKSGDTLSKISRQYGTTIKQLCQLNNISETSVIRAGQRLRIR